MVTINATFMNLSKSTSFQLNDTSRGIWLVHSYPVTVTNVRAQAENMKGSVLTQDDTVNIIIPGNIIEKHAGESEQSLGDAGISLVDLPCTVNIFILKDARLNGHMGSITGEHDTSYKRYEWLKINPSTPALRIRNTRVRLFFAQNSRLETYGGYLPTYLDQSLTHAQLLPMLSSNDAIVTDTPVEFCTFNQTIEFPANYTTLIHNLTPSSIMGDVRANISGSSPDKTTLLKTQNYVKNAIAVWVENTHHHSRENVIRFLPKTLTADQVYQAHDIAHQWLRENISTHYIMMESIPYYSPTARAGKQHVIDNYSFNPLSSSSKWIKALEPIYHWTPDDPDTTHNLFTLYLDSTTTPYPDKIYRVNAPSTKSNWYEGNLSPLSWREPRIGSSWTDVPMREVSATVSLNSWYMAGLVNQGSKLSDYVPVMSGKQGRLVVDSRTNREDLSLFRFVPNLLPYGVDPT